MQLYTGDKLKKHCKDSVRKYAQAMYWTIQFLSDLDFEDNSLTIRERINIAKKALEILDVVYEDNYGTESNLVAQMNRYIAAMEVLEGNVDATLDHLEKAAEYAIKYDTLPEKVKLTSTLLTGNEVERRDIFKNFTWNECTELSERLPQKRYDLVRDTERFKAVEKKIAEYVIADLN